MGEKEGNDLDAMISSPIILYDYPKIAAEESDKIGLSPSMRAAVPPTVKMIESLACRLLKENSTAVSLTGT